MDIFLFAQVVKLRSHRGKYLVAKEDEETVTQDRNGSSRNAQWTVELVPGSHSRPERIFLKSCYNKYLTASDQASSHGVRIKVLQTLPRMLDNSIEWEPIREGTQFNLVKLKTHNDTFLRACQLRHNSVNLEGNTNQTILWNVEIVEMTISERLHQAASTFHNDCASAAVRQKAQSFLNLMDTNENGEVSIDEFLDFFNQFGNKMGMDRNFFAAFDRNGDGSLQLEEIITMHYVMFTRAQAAHIQQFEESLKARDQSVVRHHDAQIESRKKQNVAYQDFIMVVLQGVGLISSLTTLNGCCIM